MGLIGIIVITFAISLAFRKKIGDTFPLTVFGSAIIMYFIGKYLGLKASIVLLFAVTLLATGFGIYLLFRKKTGITYIFSYGGIALVFYLLLFGFYAINRDFSHPDEFYCWGMMAKDYYSYDTLFSEMGNAISGNHPPLAPLWFYFVNKTSGTFLDSVCYFANSILIFAPILPVFERFKGRLDSIKFIILALTLPLVAMINGLEAFYTVLPDSVIAMLMCYFVTCIFRYAEDNDYFYYISALIALSSVILIKRVGVIFAGMLIAISLPVFYKKSGVKGAIRWCFISSLICSLVAFSWFGKSFNVMIPLAMACSGLFVTFAYKFYIRLSYKNKNILIALGFLEILICVGAVSALVPKISSYVAIVIGRLVGEFLKISIADGYLNMAYGCYAVALIVFILVMRRREEASLLRQTCGMVLICMFLYLGIMLVMHITSVGPLNDYKETIIARYLIPWESLVVYIIFYYFVVENGKITTLKLTIAFLVITLMSGSGIFYKNMFYKHQSQEYDAFDREGIELKSGDMIYYVDEEYTFNYADREFFYKSYPAKTNFIYDIFKGFLDEKNVTAETLIERFDYSEEQYNYVYNYLYIQSCLDDFTDRCGSLFENPEDIHPESVYAVIKENGSYKLKLIENNN